MRATGFYTIKKTPPRHSLCIARDIDRAQPLLYLYTHRIPLVRQRPTFLRSRHLPGSDAASAVKGAKRDRSHAQPQASMARTSPLTAGGRGVATLLVGCGT
jgi:hypothetical protein